jgi:hypothetical protein
MVENETSNAADESQSTAEQPEDASTVEEKSDTASGE